MIWRASTNFGKEKHGETFEESRLGGKLHRAFMAEIGEEMSQSDVTHHANKCPEYFCSRPQRTVHMYKKALALDVGPRKRNKKGDATAPWQGAWDQEEAAVA